VPALLGPTGTTDLPAWFPADTTGARQVVLLVLDGLGWRQLETRHHLAPTLASMAGGSIDTVAPSTTATALTSITTGLTPGEHGVVGYRVAVHGEVLNVLRWSTPTGDARRRIVPHDFQRVRPFLGEKVPVIHRAELQGSGFTQAHLEGVRHAGYWVTSALAVEVRRQIAAGERFVYAYYDGVDRAAHAYGLGDHYDAEVATADRIVADVLSVLPGDAALLVTADHGQVHVGDRILEPPPEVLRAIRLQSGEGRFRWYHARPGAAHDLLAATEAAFGHVAWVRTRDQVLDEGWLGHRPGDAAVGRLGDVAVAVHEPVSIHDPADSGIFELVCRHGSLTPEEILVPLLGARGRADRR
jgi:hypothetical protein